MKCRDCPYYKSGYMYNQCGFTGDEYFREPEKCDLINDDYTISDVAIKIFGGIPYLRGD